MKDIKYLVLSDIHLGHNINKTNDIVENLTSFFITYHKELRNLDILFIAGDIWDKLLLTNSHDFLLSVSWLTSLVKYCQGHNIKLRILEGTPSHDRSQAKVIHTIISQLNINIDFKYIDTLYIEKMQDLGLSVLYVPDEYKPTADEVYEETLNMLKENQLTQADIAIMHGAFTYQVPMYNSPAFHVAERYLDIVKHYISVGHVHTPTIYDRILGQGSFDRLSHNEEEDKGAMLITISDTRPDRFKFLVNKKAMIFKSFYFKDEPIDEIVRFLEKELKKYPHYSNIRVISENEDFLHKIEKDFKKKFIHYNIKVEKSKNVNKKIKVLESKTIYESFSITKDNILKLVTDDIGPTLTNDEYKICLEELGNAI